MLLKGLHIICNCLAALLLPSCACRVPRAAEPSLADGLPAAERLLEVDEKGWLAAEAAQTAAAAAAVADADELASPFGAAAAYAATASPFGAAAALYDCEASPFGAAGALPFDDEEEGEGGEENDEGITLPVAKSSAPSMALTLEKQLSTQEAEDALIDAAVDDELGLEPGAAPDAPGGDGAQQAAAAAEPAAAQPARGRRQRRPGPADALPPMPREQAARQPSLRSLGQFEGVSTIFDLNRMLAGGSMAGDNSAAVLQQLATLKPQPSAAAQWQESAVPGAVAPAADADAAPPAASAADPEAALAAAAAQAAALAAAAPSPFQDTAGQRGAAAAATAAQQQQRQQQQWQQQPARERDDGDSQPAFGSPLSSLRGSANNAGRRSGASDSGTPVAGRRCGSAALEALADLRATQQDAGPAGQDWQFGGVTLKPAPSPFAAQAAAAAAMAAPPPPQQVAMQHAAAQQQAVLPPGVRAGQAVAAPSLGGMMATTPFQEMQGPLVRQTSPTGLPGNQSPVGRHLSGAGLSLELGPAHLEVDEKTGQVGCVAKLAVVMLALQEWRRLASTRGWCCAQSDPTCMDSPTASGSAMHTPLPSPPTNACLQAVLLQLCAPHLAPHLTTHTPQSWPSHPPPAAPALLTRALQAFLVQPVRAASDMSGLRSQVSGSSSGGPLSNEGSLVELVDALRQSGLVDGGSLPLRPNSHSPVYLSAAASGAGSHHASHLSPHASQLRLVAMRAHSEPPPQHSELYAEESEADLLQPAAGGSCNMYAMSSGLGAGLPSIGPTLSAAGPSLSLAGLTLDPLSPRYAATSAAARGPEAGVAAAAGEMQPTVSGSAFSAWLGAVGGLGLPITPYEQRRSVELVRGVRPSAWQPFCAQRSQAACAHALLAAAWQRHAAMAWPAPCLCCIPRAAVTAGHRLVSC